MTTKILKTTLVSFSALAIAFPLASSPALALIRPALTATGSQAQITTLKARGDKEIDLRITSLNAAIANIQTATKLTDEQKSALVSSDQAVVTALGTLKTKIDADTDLATLKADVRSIYTQYRVYMLVMPQTNILRASDRIQDVVANLNAFATKLQARLAQAQTAGKNVSSLQSSMTDLQAKITDAQTKAQTATNLVSGLTADAGDQARIASNKQALESARADIKVAIQDIQAAWTDAKAVVKGLKGLQ